MVSKAAVSSLGELQARSQTMYKQTNASMQRSLFGTLRARQECSSDANLCKGLHGVHASSLDSFCRCVVVHSHTDLTSLQGVSASTERPFAILIIPDGSENSRHSASLSSARSSLLDSCKILATVTRLQQWAKGI